MAEGPDEMIAFRLGPRDRAAIQRLVDAGEFRNRSDFLRYAVKSTLEHYEGARTRLELELEGVELPNQAAPARKPRAGANRNPKGVNL